MKLCEIFPKDFPGLAIYVDSEEELETAKAKIMAKIASRPVRKRRESVCMLIAVLIASVPLILFTAILPAKMPLVGIGIFVLCSVAALLFLALSLRSRLRWIDVPFHNFPRDHIQRDAVDNIATITIRSVPSINWIFFQVCVDERTGKLSSSITFSVLKHRGKCLCFSAWEMSEDLMVSKELLQSVERFRKIGK